MRVHLLNVSSIRLRRLLILGWVGVMATLTMNTNRVTAQDADAETAPGVDIDPRAVEVLKKMTAFLDSNPSIVLQVSTTWEAIQESGMKLEFSASQEIGIQRPGRMYSVEERGDGDERRLWFDGKQLTFLDVDAKKYAQIDVPGTDINSMLDHVMKTYELPAPPMLDFLYSGAEASFSAGLHAAVYVGACAKRGRQCHHLAFAKGSVDYQIWIPTTGDPLPVRYAITWVDEPQSPWFAVDFEAWNTSPSFSEARFSADLPADAERIEVSRKGASNEAP